MTLRDQHVLITGGSSGIGLAIAQQAAAEGARVSLIARDQANLQLARTEIVKHAPACLEILIASADVTQDTEVQTALKTVEATHGPIDVLITSAGVAHAGYFEEIPTEVFERTMAVNYFGTLYPIKAVLPAMRKRGRGVILLVSSGVGLHGLFGYTPYGPTKFALRGLAESLRAEMKDTGVQISIVYPPDTDTPQLAEETRTKPSETKALTAKGGIWSAENVAKLTLKGLKRGRFSITPGVPLTLLAWGHSLLAPVLYWFFDRTAKKARQQDHDQS
jgi:3-dehydrosphinganine reductase